MTSYIQVSTTFADREAAKHAAHQLVQRRLAACVQITGPILSVYRWQDAIEESEEWICTAKTRAGQLRNVADVIAELHPYDVPEIVSSPLDVASESYASWLDEQVD